MARAPWRWGGLALLIGGLVGAAGGVVFLVSAVLGIALTVIALLGVGVGLLGLAAGFRGTSLRPWARSLLTAAGVLLLLELVFSLLADLGLRGLAILGALVPPAAGIVLLLAAIVVAVDRAAPGAARWVLLLPGGWSCALALFAFVAPFDSWWVVTIGDLLFAGTGAVYRAAGRLETLA